MQFAIPNPVPRRLTPLCLLALAVILSGCSSHGSLQMVSLDHRRDYSQTFSRAYISHDPTGDSDIVLVHDEAEIRHDDPRKPLTPDPDVLPRQLVHIRVYWTALSGKADHPASTNASVKWCLLGDGSGTMGALQYSGSGLVFIDDRGDWANVTIRQAWMKLASHRGDMVDPIGPSMLNGTVRAANDPERVKSLLAEMKLAAQPPLDTQASATVQQPQHLAVTP